MRESKPSTPPLRPIATRLSRRVTVRMMVAGAVVAALFAACGFLPRNPLASLDHHVLDAFVRASAPNAQDTRAVVVDIDEISLSAVGQWPWPRYRIAALIEKIAAHHPAAIGIDVLFSEPDRASLANLQETFKRDFGVDIAISGVPDGLRDNDGYLGFVMGRHDVVAANYFYFDHFNEAPARPRSGIAIDGDVASLALPGATGVLVNTEEIATQTRRSGFINNQLDDDGLLRRVPLLIRHDGAVYPSLTLATVMKATGADRVTIGADGDGPILAFGTHRIPIDEHGYAALRYAGGPKQYAALSAVDVLNDRIEAAAIAGKVVYIGSSAAGLNDYHNTAVDPRFPGLKIHAVASANLLGDDFVRVPRWSAVANAVACAVVGIAVAALFAFAWGIHWVVLGTLCAIGLAVLASLFAFTRADLFVGPAAPLVTAVVLFVGLSVARFAIEKRRAFLWLRQLQNARQVTIESMASVAETRDPETGAHIKRTQHYVKAIAEELRRSGLHTETLTDEYIDLLFLSAPLHDIGKVGVPDHILLKPGRLTPDEFEIMKQHAEFGRKIILSSSKNIDGNNFLALAGEIAASHHEKWDGSGYPLGLAGEAIPLSGRIMATADIYDALISRRCYKEPFSHEHATSLMREGSGKTFDPAVLDAFFRIEDEIRAIANEFGDESEADAQPPAMPIDVPEKFVASLASS